jgi:2-hydroxychromene-2-carboxylate isomerase
MPEVRTVDFHFDPLCPWAYQASRWIRHVRDATGVEVRWCFFSLEEINRGEGRKHPWERDWSYGWSLMRIGARLRRDDPARLDAWYAAVGRALHEEGRPAHRPEVARDVLTETGLDAGLLDEALADPATHDEVRADHDRAVAAGAFGVPTLCLDGTDWIFGPVVLDAPAGDDAARLWDLVCSWRAFPTLYEVQRPKTATDLERIAQRFRAYLQARDWPTIQRPAP